MFFDEQFELYGGVNMLPSGGALVGLRPPEHRFQVTAACRTTHSEYCHKMVASLDTYPLQPEILQILKSTYESEDAVGSCSLRLLVQVGQSGRQHRKDSRPSDSSSIALTALIALP